MAITWLTASLDLAADDHEAGVAFWAAVTGFRLSEPHGEHGELVTLVPPVGDADLRVQRLDEGPTYLHLDVHAPGHALTTHVSPGGFVWYAVGDPGRTSPPATAWPSGHRSRVDQVCLDIPADRYDAECAFWSDLTGWAVTDSASYAEFRRLQTPPDAGLKVLLQRLEEPTGRVRAHLDLATDDRAAETERHRSLGATVDDVRPGWTVLRDPAGSAYCITDRSPG